MFEENSANPKNITIFRQKSDPVSGSFTNKNKHHEKSTKSLLFGVLGAAVLAGAYQNYRMSQTEKIASNLTLDNIESLALIMDCYAEATCPSGAVIHCSGGSSCESGPNESGGSYVICDGKYGSSCN